MSAEKKHRTVLSNRQLLLEEGYGAGEMQEEVNRENDLSNTAGNGGETGRIRKSKKHILN